MFCARGKDESASKRIRGRNIAVAPLGLVFLRRMQQINLFAVAEIPNLLFSDNGVQRSRPCQIVGCVGVGIARKLKFPPRQEKSPRAHRERFEIRTRESSARKRRAKRHDATRWRTQSLCAADAVPRTVLHRSAPLSPDGC